MDFLKDYIVLMIVGICLCVGFVIKKWVKDVENKYIPTIVAILGIILSTWDSGWTFTPQVILSGLISGLASTGMYELFNQFISKNSNVPDEKPPD